MYVKLIVIGHLFFYSIHYQKMHITFHFYKIQKHSVHIRQRVDNLDQFMVGFYVRLSVRSSVNSCKITRHKHLIGEN